MLHNNPVIAKSTLAIVNVLCVQYFASLYNYVTLVGIYMLISSPYCIFILQSLT